MDSPPTITVMSIGYGKKSAEAFFELLRTSGARRLIDVRIRTRSGYVSWAKQDDLQYLLRELCGMEYEHRPVLAPTLASAEVHSRHASGAGRPGRPVAGARRQPAEARRYPTPWRSQPGSTTARA